MPPSKQRKSELMRWRPGLYVTTANNAFAATATPEYRNVIAPTFTAIAQAMARADKITNQRKESK